MCGCVCVSYEQGLYSFEEATFIVYFLVGQRYLAIDFLDW